MPKQKLKTKRSAAKRYSFTGTGKVKHAKCGKSHILTKKNRKRKRRLRSATVMSAADKRMAKTLVPYK